MIRPSRHACTVYGSRLPHSSFILPISLSFLVLYILALAAPTSATIRQTPLRSLTSISPPSGSNNGSPRGRQASVSEYSPSHPRPNGAALTKPRADLRYRSIYQVLTDRFGLGPELGVGPNGEERIVRCDPDERRYCGGTWKGIEMRLEYIQGMGFDSVWISPIVQNIEVPPGAHEPYHGYWAADIYQLNSRFGTMQDLLDLSAAIHARGMYLMVDIVANHLGAYHENPFMASRQYGPFDHEDDFHPKKFPDDWDDQEQVEQRWLGAETPDLNTESPRVIRTLHHWISTLIPHFSIDFIRIDTVKHVRKSFWPDFVHSAGVPAMGEVLHGDPAYLAPYQKEAMASLLDFGNFFHLRRVFGGTTGDVGELVEMMGRLGGLMQTSMLGSFLDNHDFERLAGLVTDNALVKNAAVFPFINDGFPIVYQGQEHGLTGGKDPMNREAVWLHGYRTDTEMYHLFRRLNRARRTALSHPAFLTTPARATRISSHIISIRNSPLLTVLNNLGTRSAPTVAYLPQAQTGYKPLLVVIDVISGQVLGTDQKGGLSVPIVNGEPRVFLPLALHRGQSVSVGEWYKEPMSLDMGNKVGGGGEGSGSPGSPGRHTAKTPSFGRVMSWLGMGSGGKS